MNLHKEMSRETPLRIIGDSSLKYAASQPLFTMPDDARTHVKEEPPDPELLFDAELLHPSSIVDLLGSDSSSLDNDSSNSKNKRKETEKGFDGVLPVGFLMDEQLPWHYELPPSAEWDSSDGGMDYVRVYSRFLHSNATSHKWDLAELLVNIDMVKSKKDGSKMLMIEDNGSGMVHNI